MTFSIPEQLAFLTSGEVVDTANTIVRVFGPPVLTFIGGLWGARTGMNAYRKSVESRINEAREARAFLERRKVGILDTDHDVMKEYFNSMTRQLFALADDPVSERHNKARVILTEILPPRMKAIADKLSQSDALTEYWSAFEQAKEEMKIVYKGDLNGEKPNAVFNQLRATWLQFFLQASPRNIGKDELLDLLFMGVKKSIFKNDGRNPRHESGESQKYIDEN